MVPNFKNLDLGNFLLSDMHMLIIVRDSCNEMKNDTNLTIELLIARD